MSTLKNLGLSLAIAAASAAVAGCEDKPEPNVPTAQPGGPPVLGAPQPGQQWTIPNATPGANDPNLPKLSGSAAGPYQQGINAFVSGDMQGAKKFFTEATSADSRAYQAYYSLGVVQERLKDDGAMASYRQAFTIQPTYENAVVAFGLLKARKNQLSEADSFLTGKKGEMPKSAPVAAALAEVKSLERNSSDAQALASEALKLNPDYRPAMVVIARDHFRNRKLDLALFALQAILDGFKPISENPPRDPGNAEALLLRGLIFKEQNRRADAIDNFSQAIAKRPDLVEARVQLATYLLQSGDADKAQSLLEGALRFDADNLTAHLLLADSFRLLGRYGDAKQGFDFVLGKDSSLPMAYYDLGLLYLFAPAMPGMTPLQQVDAAKTNLEKFQQLRDKGTTDDSDELLQRVKLKRGEIELASAPPPADVPIPKPADAKPADAKPADAKPAGK